MSKPGAAGGSSTETVKVMVRVRPMNTKEKTKGKYPDTLISIHLLILTYFNMLLSIFWYLMVLFLSKDRIVVGKNFTKLLLLKSDDW